VCAQTDVKQPSQPSVANLPQETLDFAGRMFDAARSGSDDILLQAVDAGLPVNLTNDKGEYRRHLYDLC